MEITFKGYSLRLNEILTWFSNPLFSVQIKIKDEENVSLNAPKNSLCGL